MNNNLSSNQKEEATMHSPKDAEESQL